MALKDQINQNVGFFIYNLEFLFFSGIIGSPQAFNRFQIIPDPHHFNFSGSKKDTTKLSKVFKHLKDFIY